jgi:hypothetical protein
MAGLTQTAMTQTPGTDGASLAPAEEIAAEESLTDVLASQEAGLGGAAAAAPGIGLDEEFRHLVPAHSPAERATLQQQLLADGECLEPLVVWEGHRILPDGYTRLAICTRHGLPYRTVELPFAGRAEARAWVLAHHSGRRNLTPNGLSYVRGKRYLLERQPQGGDRRDASSSGQTDHLANQPANGQNDHLRTEARLARE